MKRYLILLTFIILFFIWAIYLPREIGSEKEVIFNMKRGEGSKEIALNLEKEGLIRWAPVFRLYVLTMGVSDKLQAGKYLLSPSMNILKIAEKFSQGEVATIKITIPEGFTSEQIHDRLKNVTVSDALTLAEYEGYLFPDTYEIPYDMALGKIIEMMRNNFDQKTAGLEITPEAVVMASLLEKELKTKEDKKIASGILWKRLQVRMPLQVDAHPWTYENQGLPVKPICNPGLESIEAALFPENSDYWYYLSTPEGQTIFSKTLEEHNYAKSIYLK